MLNTRSDKLNLRKHRNSTSVFSLRLLIIVFLVCHCGTVFSQNGPKRVYEIHDPRNPDCPCHDLQKKAEKEFAILNEKKGRFDNFTRIRRKHRILINKLKFRVCRKLKIKKRIRSDYSVCFKW